MAFDLVVSRHPVTVWWTEIARVLRPGGRYFSQQVGPAGVFEPVEFFLGPQPEAAGLRVVDLRAESLRTEFFDIGAVVYFLRKVIWMVPDFTVDPRVRRVRPPRARAERANSLPPADLGERPPAITPRTRLTHSHTTVAAREWRHTAPRARATCTQRGEPSSPSHHTPS